MHSTLFNAPNGSALNTLQRRCTQYPPTEVHSIPSNGGALNDPPTETSIQYLMCQLSVNPRLLQHGLYERHADE